MSYNLLQFESWKSDIHHHLDKTPLLLLVTCFSSINIVPAESDFSYFGAYNLPFHVTPLRDNTFHVEANIIAPNTAAPNGVVSAYQREICILLATIALT